MHELDHLAAELDTHAVAVHDRRPHDVLLQFLRGDLAVLVEIRDVEPSRKHAADPRPRVGRDVNLVAVDDAVVVAIDHVARHLRVTTVHVSQHVLVADESGGRREYGATRGMGKKGVPLETFADNSLVDKMIREGFIDRLYKKP